MIRTPYGVNWADYLCLLARGTVTKTCHVRGQEILVAARSAIELWRCKTYETKEPETLDWVDGFKSEDTLFDIGANIGMYSLYAGKRGIRVFSFEPEAQNYTGLVQNCIKNKLGNVTPYCMALAEREHLDLLFLTSATPGDSQHNLGENNPLYRRESFGTQGVFATTLDALCFEHDLPIPQHIKIDVDGLEDRILEGGRRVLSNPAFRTLLIEISGHGESMPPTIEALRTIGLRPLRQAARAYRDGEMWARNYIFGRDGTI